MIRCALSRPIREARDQRKISVLRLGLHTPPLHALTTAAAPPTPHPHCNCWHATEPRKFLLHRAPRSVVTCPSDPLESRPVPLSTHRFRALLFPSKYRTGRKHAAASRAPQQPEGPPTRLPARSEFLRFLQAGHSRPMCVSTRRASRRVVRPPASKSSLLPPFTVSPRVLPATPLGFGFPHAHPRSKADAYPSSSPTSTATPRTT
jgi:hypothetical protein